MASKLLCRNCGWSASIEGLDEWTVKDMLLDHIAYHHTVIMADLTKDTLEISFLDVDESEECAVCHKYFRKKDLGGISLQCGEHTLDGYICSKCHEWLFDGGSEKGADIL